MDQYLQNKQKLKAIARYTFNNICPTNSTLSSSQKPQVSTIHVIEALKLTLERYQANTSLMQIQDMVESVDRSHKGMIGFQDFTDLFEKAFEKLWDIRNFNNKAVR